MVVAVLVLAGLAVLGAIVVLAMGRGGELAPPQPDYVPLPPMDGRPLTGAEAAMLRPPRALWGYQPAVTDEAMRRMVSSLAERDAQIHALEARLAAVRHPGEGGATAADAPLPTPLPWDTTGLDAAGRDTEEEDA
ncbi:hypothetical protein [Actinomadura parmotrematis]|uniref:DivIVA domain-containing protein n=1 Tax=Actinomadura parmotrematis TaxID=2864039 RepID=A0ABS7FNN1_9ACTN|nr:hypothetical protein [Actinomadura parmotrematis]MBW8481374.1 hypothetical protein [Actinomadura parmotrematis]